LRQYAGVTIGKNALAEQIIERRGAIAHDHHLVHDAIFLERAQRQRLIVLIVLNEQYNFAFHVRMPLSVQR
jgi:hypothetical protein